MVLKHAEQVRGKWDCLQTGWVSLFTSYFDGNFSYYASKYFNRQRLTKFTMTILPFVLTLLLATILSYIYVSHGSQKNESQKRPLFRSAAGVFMTDCGLCRNIIKQKTNALDFSVLFSSSDLRIQKGSRRVFRAMKKALNETIIRKDKEIEDFLRGSNKYFVGIDHIYALPDRKPSALSTDPSKKNLIYFFDGTKLDIQFSYDCCGDMGRLTNQVFKQVVSTLVDEKETIASDFEHFLVVPANWTYSRIDWVL